MKKIHNALHFLHSTDSAALLIRLALAAVFINAGWMKITNMEMVVQGFGDMGFHSFFAYFVSYLELIGGIAFLVGLFVRYFGVLLAITMLVAGYIHFGNGFSLAQGGYEYVLVLFFNSLAMTTMGAGKYSLARAFKLCPCKDEK
jgi:putative oxidoreductase